MTVIELMSTRHDGEEHVAFAAGRVGDFDEPERHYVSVAGKMTLEGFPREVLLHDAEELVRGFGYRYLSVPSRQEDEAAASPQEEVAPPVPVEEEVPQEEEAPKTLADMAAEEELKGTPIVVPDLPTSLVKANGAKK